MLGGWHGVATGGNATSRKDSKHEGLNTAYLSLVTEHPQSEVSQHLAEYRNAFAREFLGKPVVDDREFRELVGQRVRDQAARRDAFVKVAASAPVEQPPAPDTPDWWDSAVNTAAGAVEKIPDAGKSVVRGATDSMLSASGGLYHFLGSRLGNLSDVPTVDLRQQLAETQQQLSLHETPQSETDSPDLGAMRHRIGMIEDELNFREGKGESFGHYVRNLLSMAGDEAQRIQEKVEEAVPASEEWKGGFGDRLFMAVGQLAALPLYEVPGVGPSVTFFQNYEQGRRDYEASRLRDGKGYDPAMADKAGVGFALGTPAETAVNYLMIGKVLKQLVGKPVGPLKRMLGTIFAGGVEGAAEQVWQNEVARYLGYDDKRELTDGMLDSLVMGLLVTSFGTAAYGAARKKEGEIREMPQPETGAPRIDPEKEAGVPLEVGARFSEQKNPSNSNGQEIVNEWSNDREKTSQAVGDILSFERVPDHELDQRTREKLAALEDAINPPAEAGEEGPTRPREILVSARPRESGLNEKGQAALDFIRSFEGLTGKQVLFIDTLADYPRFAGAVTKKYPDTIFLQARGDRSPVALIGHEWGETLKFENPELFNELQGELSQYVDSWDRNANDLKNDLYQHPDTLNSELANNIVGDSFNHPDFWQHLSQTNKPLFRRAVDSVQRWFAAFRGKAHESEWGTESFVTNLDAIHRAVMRTFEKSLEQRAKTEGSGVSESIEGEGVSFSLNAKQITDERGIHYLVKPRENVKIRTNEPKSDPSYVLEAILRGSGDAVAQQRWKYGRQIASHSSLLAWAQEHGRVLHSPDFRDYEAGGGEHSVIFDKRTGRLFKLTKPGLYGAQAEDAGAYLQRLALANRVFGDDLRFEGMTWLPGEDDARAV